LTRFRRTSITCPCCGKKYVADIMYSTIWSGEVSTDLLRFTMGKMPVNFLVHTCPACGWSGQEERPAPVPPEVQRFIRESITPRLKGRDVPPWRKWEYHALIRQAAGEDDFELGSIYLLAAQCARLGEEYDEEKRYRLRSIEHYVKAIKEENVPDDSVYQTTYLVGELYRRVGDTWKSREWYQKVLKMDLEHERQEFFVDLARRQMTTPGNFIDEEHEREASRRQKTNLVSRLKRLLGAKDVRY
jgi:uncharacterized protein (DUF2225 family)